MADDSLWDEFNLAERNSDPGAGILYCLRYDKDRIKGHQVAVVSALKDMGAGIEDAGDMVGVRLPDRFDESKRENVFLLLEELSCLNEALEYCAVGFNRFDSVNELRSNLMCTYLSLLHDSNMVDAYDMVSLGIPQIVNDLRIADSQNNVLSREDRRELSDLVSFVKRQDHILNSPGQYVILG